MKLTKEEILNLTPYGLNVEIDRHIFERKFMSIEEMKENSEYWWKSQPGVVTFTAGYEAWIDGSKEFKYMYRTKAYSTDIAAAWKVVEATSDYSWTIQREGDYLNEGDMWEVICTGHRHTIHSKDIADAICRVALISRFFIPGVTPLSTEPPRT